MSELEGQDVLRELVGKWRAEVKERAGAGCGCYGKSTMQRKCADELEAAAAALSVASRIEKCHARVVALEAQLAETQAAYNALSGASSPSGETVYANGHVYPLCFATGCGCIATHGKFCETHQPAPPLPSGDSK